MTIPAIDGRRDHRKTPLPKPASLMERFWSKVDTSDPRGCWPWRGATNGKYGVVKGTDGRQTYAHRVAWELENGALPHGVDACHACDNPICARPSHIFAGTRADNMADMVAKGRTCGVLTAAQAQEIRALVSAGVTRRVVAVRFGVGVANVSHIVNHRTWRL